MFIGQTFSWTLLIVLDGMGRSKEYENGYLNFFNMHALLTFLFLIENHRCKS